MAIIVASMVISVLVVQGSSAALIDPNRKILKLPGGAMFPFTSIGDETSFMQSSLHRNKDLKKLSAPNASNYIITSYNNPSCHGSTTKKRTDHLMATGTPGCFNVVEGSLAGSSFRLSCPEGDVAEQVMQQMYRHQDCQGKAFMRKTMKWKLFKGMCQNQQKIDRPLRYEHFPPCKRKVELRGVCDCSWVKTKRKSCEASLDDGSPCFTICCGKASSKTAATPAITATSMDTSTNQTKSFNLAGQDKMINVSSKQNLVNDDIMNNSVNHTRVMKSPTNQSKVASDSISQRKISNAAADQVVVKVPETLPNLVDTPFSGDPKAELIRNVSLQSNRDMPETNASSDPKAPVDRQKARLPYLVGTCECTWANKQYACSGLRRMGYCQRTCCEAKKTVHTVSTTEQIEAHAKNNQSRETASRAQMEIMTQGFPTRSQSQKNASHRQIKGKSDAPLLPVNKTPSSNTQSQKIESLPAIAQQPNAFLNSAWNKTHEQIEGEKLERQVLTMQKKAEKLGRIAQETEEQADKAKQKAKDLKIQAELADIQFQKLSKKATNMGKKAQAWSQNAEAFDEQAKVLITEAHCKCDSAMISKECAKHRHRSYCGRICCVKKEIALDAKHQNQSAVWQVRKTM